MCRKIYSDSKYPLYVKIICDINCNIYQCEANGIIVLENSEYAVYQKWQKVDTSRYNSFEDFVWQFVPIGMNVPQQGYNVQYPAQNNQ